MPFPEDMTLPCQMKIKGSFLRDVYFAKDFLNFGLTAKFAFWGRLPWKLLGLAHHFSSSARAVAQAVVNEYDESIASGRITDVRRHPLTRRFLSSQHVPSLREHVDAFAGGMPMPEALAAAVAGLKLVPVVERVVEGLHRDVKIASKHIQLGPTKVSLSVRMREIRATCENPEMLRSLTEKFEVVRNLKQAAVTLGVLCHPEILELAYARESDTTVWWIRLQRVVHRCDLREQFKSLQQVRVTHTRQHETDRRTALALRDVSAPSPPRAFEGIMKRFIVERLSATADANGFFSLPAQRSLQQGASYELAPLTTGPLAQQPQIERDAADRGWILQRSEEAAAVPTDRMVFRMLHASPSRMKFVPGPMYSSLRDSASGPCINMSSQAAPQCLRSLESCPLQVLREDLLRWNVSSGEGFSSPEVVAMVSSLIDAKGIPDEPYVECSAPEDLCVCLEQRGFLEIAPVRHPQVAQLLQARLSQRGMQSLQVVGSLCGPEPVCSMSNVPPSECDAWDLALKLEAAGWQWKPMPRNTRARQALTYARGSPKIWYSLLIPSSE